MELTNEREMKSGDYQFDVECTTEEIVHLRTYALEKGQDIANMTDEEIMQFSVVGLLKDEMEKEERNEDEQD
jgi:hypothetical protein